jgi:D-serine deaminase-like pyridoxal phosphate-dependent protein
VILERSADQPWSDPAEYWGALSAATGELDPPYGAISLAALAHNAFDMLDRANGKPIRVASKSVRARGVIDAVLDLDGYSGVLAFSLAEALWLATDGEHGRAIDDVVVGYPSVDRSAILALATSPELARRVTIMIDSVEHLDVIDAVLPPSRRETIRVCLELDASWESKIVGYTGVRRSPVHSVEQMTALAQAVSKRAGFRIVGVMGYEAQIAGQVNRPVGRPAYAVAVNWMQNQSAAELAERRGAAVASVRTIAELEFVNGGGTGSIERTAADESVTEIAAGSGLFGPHLFDNYTHFRPAPAAAFTLSVVRKPQPNLATLLGGGWIASGPPGIDRLPQLVWPDGLRMLPREMAGEVQTPVSGPAARELRTGDRVWARHTKAGEISEHIDEFAVVDDGKIVEMVRTYRGNGKAFL